MKRITQNATNTLMGFCLLFMFFCVLQVPAALSAQRQNAQRDPNARRSNVGDPLKAEWRVKCEVTTYQNGDVLKVSHDDDESLVVIESDSDGSYQLYKFPVGLGEGFPRLRNVGAGKFSGADTVRGITTLVQQSIEVEGERIRIRQTVIDSSSKQRQTETTCSGARLRSVFGMRAADQTPEICFSSRRSGDLPVKSLARRYKSTKPFSDGMAAVALVPRGERTQKWGFIDDNGRVLIPMRYDVVTAFYDGLAAVGKFYGRGRNLKWGVVEKLGPQVTPHVHYDAVKILGEGLAAVGYAVPGRSGVRWNLINRENTTVFYGFDDIGCFLNGRADASYTDGKGVHTGYINRIGDFFADKE